jgi:hypothetical protein
MSMRERAKAWAKQQTDDLRSDPKAWARSQSQRLRKMVDVAPFSDAVLGRQLTSLRGRMARLEELDAGARQALVDEVLALHGNLTPGGAMMSGAKIGIAAAVLPVVGIITGPILGGAYGVYRSQQLGQVRGELEEMLRQLARR